MPQTRNISRAQWDAANTNQISRAKVDGYDSEKENEGRSTRARTQAGSRQVFGAITTISTTAGTGTHAKKKTKSKGKDKPPSKGTKTKTGKLPLQDITTHFLPAPESENRGYVQGNGRFIPASPVDHASVGPSSLVQYPHSSSVAQPAATRIRANIFPSSLPPSSPPSASSSAQQFEPNFSGLPLMPPSPTTHIPAADRMRSVFDILEDESTFDKWNEFDDVVRESGECEGDGETPMNSDPFGFFALERKLKAERNTEMEDDMEAGGLILVADTSSPRPVPRLSQKEHGFQDERRLSRKRHHDQLEDDDAKGDLSYIPSMPPTPHKEKGKGRPSYDGDEKHIVSPNSSSLPSTPSPSKPTSSSAKRTTAGLRREQQEEGKGDQIEDAEGNKRAKLERSSEKMPFGRLRNRRTQHGQKEGTKNDEGECAAMKREPQAVKKRSSSGKKSKKVNSKISGNSEVDEKWEQERQARLALFRRLEEYKVEEENVYVI